MEDADQGYNEWTEEELVRETVSNFESLEGVDSVEWTTQSPASLFQDLICVKTHRGAVIRLGIAYLEEDEDVDPFYGRFFL